MSLQLPQTATEIFDRMSVDYKNSLPDLDPFDVRRNSIRAKLSAEANAFFEQYNTLGALLGEAFWDTATGEFLLRWAAIFGITQNPASKATGFVTFTGIDTTAIPINTQFTSTSGSFYETLSAATITATTISILSITRVGQTATVTTATDHGFASNNEPVISGANETEYNGTFTIVVTGLNTFEYTIEGTPATPATGSIVADLTYANVDAESIDFGVAQNLSSGATITLASPIAGVDNQGFVSFDEISGGADQESEESLRDRLLFRVQNPVASFNEAAIINKAREVPGVTRVFVQGPDVLDGVVTASSLTRVEELGFFESTTPHGLNSGAVVTVSGANEGGYNRNSEVIVINRFKFAYLTVNFPTTPATGSPIANFAVSRVGQVRIFFVRDNDVPIIPTPSEVAEVKAKILEIKNVTDSEANVFVDGPVPLIVDFTFLSITPDTPEMRTAIQNSLDSYFKQGTSVAQNVSEEIYRSVIITTVDSTGTALQDFTLDAPIGDIIVDISELPILGTVTFP